MEKIRHFAEGTRLKLVGSVFLSLLSVTSGLVPYLIVAHLILLIRGGDLNQQKLLINVVGIIGAYGLKIICSGVSTELSHQAAYHILLKIRKALIHHLTELPLGVVTERSSGVLKNLIVETVEKIEAPFAHLIPELSANVLVSVMTFIYLVYLDRRLALIALITIPLGLVFYKPLMKKYKRHYKENVEASNQLNSEAVEYINGIEAIKIFNHSEASFKNYQEAVKQSLKTMSHFFVVTLPEYTAVMTIIPSTLVLVLPSALMFYVSGTLTFDDFILVIMLSLGFTPPLIQAIKYTDQIASMGTVMNEVSALLALETLKRPRDHQDISSYDIELKHVSFAYQDKSVLHQVNLKAKANEMTAIVGPSGSGKSTIAKLIASFWDVKEGTIEIGGVDIRSIPFEQLRTLISYVAQDNFLFNLSIEDNIKMGNPKATHQDVVRAAKMASCHEFIVSLEAGYETVVGNGGNHLSGGEMQRISIARAILKDAPIIVLDEATAFTDPENETHIQASINQLVKGKTLIVIAHRLSTIAHAEQIVLIDKGEIVAKGTHQSLLDEQPLYNRMWHKHRGDYCEGGKTND